ncbi:MAG: cation:dicarboxylase symporter family transporter, partial [Planctomycetales bacterium]
MSRRDAASTHVKKTPSFTTMLVVGIILGTAWGLFLGEHGAWVKWIGDAYVGLLQMTVLPFVVVSLICNVGRLSRGEGGRLARVALGVLLFLWLVGFLTLLAMCLCFPPWDGGSFFSTNLVTEPEPTNWLELFIPANVFLSLTNNLVPAVVVFSIGFGVALIPVTDKDVLLQNLDVVMDGLSRLNKLVVRLSPLGVFAIVGHATGTISLENFLLLQGYLLAYGAAALLLVFWILPSLIASCTPLSHREILRESRPALIAAFIIGNTFVVLPMIHDAVERLMEKLRAEPDERTRDPGYTVELAYPFPDLGRIVTLLFIPFAAWFYGTPIENSQVVPLLGAGFAGSFAKPVVAIPMLLDLAAIPTDIFNLFLAIGVIASRFGDLMKAMHLLAFAVLTACWLQGAFRIQPVPLMIRGLATAGLVAAMVFGIRIYLADSFQHRFDKEHLIVARELLATPAESAVLKRSEPNPAPLLEGEDRMDRILRRGILRVGFNREQLPFSYYNRDRRLVGFDVEMAHQLARDLGVRIEFVPFSGEIIQPLLDDHFDVAMSGLESTIERATALPRMDPYLEVTRAVVVPDHRRHHFQSLKTLMDLAADEAP